jgi:hypothetical protein
MDSLNLQNFTSNQKVYKMEFADYHALVSPILDELLKLNPKTFKLRYEHGFIPYIHYLNEKQFTQKTI